jgi:threonine dehydrogenase-like Zn-dependent dehydrogenase
MVYAIDSDPRRLQRAEEFGMIPIDVAAHPDIREYLLSIRPQGVDKAIEASGYRSTQQPSLAAMRASGLGREITDPVSAIIKATRKGGNIALVRDFFFTTHDFPIGPFTQKALTVRGGQSIPQRV